MSRQGNLGFGGLSRLLRVGGVVVGAVSCLPMIAMLPSALGALLAAVGVQTGSGPWAALASVLAPAAGAMFAVSAVMLVVGCWRCGPVPTLLSAVGVGLLFVGMYVVPDDMGTDGAAMSEMSAAGSNTSPASVTFYLGVTAVTASLVLSARRRRLRRCRPIAAPPWLRQTAGR